MHAHYNKTIMSELAYRISTQQRALARDWLFMDPVMDRRARQRHFECAQRLAARLIAGDYFKNGSVHLGQAGEDVKDAVLVKLAN